MTIPEKMTPEEFWEKFREIGGPFAAEIKRPVTLGTALIFARKYADFILAAYRVSQEEDAGKMTAKQFWDSIPSSRHYMTMTDFAEAYHQYRAGLDEGREGEK